MARRSSDAGIFVHGLPELSRALKQLGGDFPKELRNAGKDVASFVASEARAKAQSIGGVAAHVASSVKPSAGAQYAGVASRWWRVPDGRGR